MGNTGLLRREAEMTLLQPQLGETRHQQLRNSSFWPSSLFKSQLVQEGEDFLLKKGTSKDLQGFGPYQNKPFHGPHKKIGSYRKCYGGNSSQAVTNHFPQPGGNGNSEAPEVIFDPTLGDEGVETPSPNDSSMASLSPLVRGRLRFFRKRLANKQMFIKHAKHYHQWLRTAIPFKTISGQISSDPIRVQGPSKDQTLASCMGLFCQEHN